MSRTSRSCSDIREVSKIKSITQPIGLSDSIAKTNVNGRKCIYVADPSNTSMSVVNGVEIEEINIPSLDLRNKFLSRKSNNFTEMMNAVIGSDIRNNKKIGKPRSTTNSKPFSQLREDKQALRELTSSEIENLREIIRINKGLPATRKEKRKSINVFKTPTLPPRQNRASYSRYRCSRMSLPKFGKFYSSRTKLEKVLEPIKETIEEVELRKLKDLAKISREHENPSYKFNRVFALRYQHNKGNPAMPNSFRQSYERYRKPIFRIVKGFELPKKYLMPEFGKHEISLFGLANEPPISLTSVRKQQNENPYDMKKRKAVEKRGRVVRVANAQPTGRKMPWNYGTVNFTQFKQPFILHTDTKPKLQIKK